MATTRQAEFARQYLVDLDAIQAAIRAGYTPMYARKHAHTLLKHPEVSRLVAEGMGERSKRLEISQDKVMSDLEAAREGAMEKGDFGSAIKASHLQGKHIGMFGDKLEVTGTLEHVLKGIPDDEIKRELEALRNVQAS